MAVKGGMKRVALLTPLRRAMPLNETDTTGGSAGTSYTYEYDRGGNILEKNRYTYVAGTGALGTALASIAYAYGDMSWKDKLTAYDGAGIIYDEIGNPLTYDGQTYAWENGRRLKSMTKKSDGAVTSFKYDYNGLRVEKSSSEVVSKYIWHGDKVVHMTKGNTALHFFYDTAGRPAMVKYGNAYYGYQLNLQNDVVCLVDSNGAEVIRYTYDAWGDGISRPRCGKKRYEVGA